MNFYHKDIKLNGRSECVYLYPISDIHYGAEACDLGKLKQTIKEIKDTPNAYWFTLGDNVDAINASDKRFSIKSVYRPLLDMAGGLDNLVNNQTDEIAKLLRPIASKCLFIMTGNHEETAKRIYHVDSGTILAHALGVGNLDETAMARIRFERSGGNSKCPSKVLTMYLSHGFGGGRSGGVKLNKLESMAGAAGVEADIYIMGHVHALIHEELETMHLTRTKEMKLIAKNKGFLVAGTYLKTFGKGYTTYSERAGFPPTRTGGARIKIIPFNHISGEGSRTNGINSDDQLRFTIENLTYEV